MTGRCVGTTASLGLALLASSLLASGGCGENRHAGPDGGGDGAGDGKGDAGRGDPTAIVVDTPSGMIATGAEDGYCDLLEAAAAAATGYSVNECANHNGVARIVLRSGKNYPLPKTLRLFGATEIAIADGDTGSATITGAAGFAVSAGEPSSACLVFVADAKAKVSLHDVTLTQAPGGMLSGACIAKGALDLRRVHVTGFRESGVVATCLPISGCDHEGDSDQATTLRILGSLVDGNRAAGKGGGVSSEGTGATVIVMHSAIVNNTSDDDGGGIYLGGGWGTDLIQDSTISGNATSGVGGGVLVRFAEKTNTYVNILNSTIANNTAAGTGGGIQFEPAQLGVQDVSVFSSIVAGNFSPSTMEWNINAAWNPRGLFNCVNGSFIYVTPENPRPNDMGSCTFDVRNPLLGPLTPLGGEGDLPLHPLRDGSPAIDGTVGDHTRDEQRDSWIDNVDPGAPADWLLFDPVVDGNGDGTAVRDLGAYERNDRWQTELLTVRAQGPSAHTVVTIPAGYDRGAGTAYNATSATNEFVTYALPIAEAGRYDVLIGARKDPNGGKFQVELADAATGPWTPLGGEQDGYGATSTLVTVGPFTTPLLASPGEKLVRFRVTGKNPASAGYRLYLDFIEARRSTSACPVVDLAAGGSHTCALTARGGVRCFGGNASGQLGDGGGADRPSPPAADVLSGATALVAGGAHTCALSADGSVRCWGANEKGQLGDGSTSARPTPGDAVLSGVKAIAAGRAHTCALMMTGGVRCWGANQNGQLGDGTTINRLRPPTTDVLSAVKAVAAGGEHTCAVTSAGGVRCWGANGSGQLGNGTMTDLTTPSDTDVTGNAASVSAGDTHTCVVTTAGGVRCWGHNNDGELGIGSYDQVLAPLNSDVLSGVKQVVAGNLFTCALTAAGGVRCWGYNSHGEIGDETTLAVDRKAPGAVDILDGVVSLAAGFTHVCARMATGGVRCWGGNDAGQLGDGMGPIFALTPPPMDIPGFTGTCD